MRPIDAVLDKITIYRLVVYVLVAISMLSLGFALSGRLPASATAMVISLALLLSSAYATERGLGRWFGLPTNSESWLISALILFLIVQPANSPMAGVVLVVAAALTSASKFILARHGKHIFNPAAFAAAILSLTGLGATTWWVGSSLLWPATLILGLAVVRKLRRFELVLSFAVVSTTAQIIQVLADHQPLIANLERAALSSPLIFLGTIMLTEPATMPPRRNQQIIFGGLIGLLYVTALQIGPFSVYPEVALLAGNLYAFAVAPKFRLKLQLTHIQRISDHVYNYIFAPERPFKFLPGQYMEWTLADVPFDSRGNRRTFTIASSPTEPSVQLGVKYYEPASAYKTTLASLQPGDHIYASQLAGNFTLPQNRNAKLAFIAGGIGITPFRSMIKYLTDQNLASDAILLYVVSDPREFAYSQVLNDARRIGIRTVSIVTKADHELPGVVIGKLSPQLIAHLIPDFAGRLFYVSGPNTMVDATKQHLRTLDIEDDHIKTDHFSGY